MKNLIKLFAFLMLMGATQLNAQVVPANQKIVRGVKSGTLTPKETKRLKLQQKNLNRTVARANADGIVTPRERRAIKTKRKALHRNIAIQKRDPQRRA